MTMNIRVGIVIAAAAGAAACGGGTTASPEANVSPAVQVVTDRVTRTTLAATHEAGGVLTSTQTAVITARIMAPILRITVQPGDRVRRGQLLIELESAEASAQVARADAGLAAARASVRAAESEQLAAQAALVLATANHTRITTLQRERSATTQELDIVVAGLKQAEARVAAAAAQLDAAARGVDAAQAGATASTVARGWATLVAPIDGLVVARHADPGSTASPGQPLLTIEAPGALQMDVRLDASRAAAIAIGQTAEVRVETGAVSQWTSARVVEVARIDPQSHSFVVTLQLAADPTWRSGYFGRARFSAPGDERLTVASAAVVTRGQLTYVYQVGNDGHARLRVVSLGRVAGDRVEVLSGLSDNDRVVVNPPTSLGDGVQVRS